MLFASGSADLKQSAKSTLDKVIGAIKKDYPGKLVIVRGYTDTDPIVKTKDKWEDNLDLSAARARTVAKYLTMQGLDQKHVGMQALADTDPKGSRTAAVASRSSSRPGNLHSIATETQRAQRNLLFLCALCVSVAEIQSFFGRTGKPGFTPVRERL